MWYLFARPATIVSGGRWNVSMLAPDGGRPMAATVSGTWQDRGRGRDSIEEDREHLRHGPPRLMLMDGHSLAYRAFYALPRKRHDAATGQPTHAIYGFTSMLVNTLRDERAPRTSGWRSTCPQDVADREFPDYKAQSAEDARRVQGQIELIGELLDAMSVHAIRGGGFEADDVIATITTQAEAEGFEVLIVTGDRDSLQLVTENITVPVSDEGRRADPVHPEKVGEVRVTPAQYPDFAALRGDPSDNLPGIPGVGEKTAAKWINEFGSFADLVERVEEVKGKAGQNLRDHLDAVKLNRRLTEMVRDVELVTLTDLERAAYDRKAVAMVLDTLEIRNPSPRERLLAVDPGARGGDAGRSPSAVSRWTGRCSAGRAGGLAQRARHRVLGARGHGRTGRGQRLGRRGRARGGGGSGGLVDPAELDQADESGVGGLAGRRGPAQGVRQREGRGCGSSPSTAGRWPGQHGHGARRVPGQAGSPFLRPGRAVPGVPRPRAGARRDGGWAACLRRGRRRGGRGPDGGGPRDRRPGRGVRRALAGGRRGGTARGTWSCRRSALLARWSGTASRPTGRPGGHGAVFAAPCSRR